MKQSNLLIHETSPYLLQHAYNPVQWRAWNPETWQLARKLDKPVIISIGYSACHWCHVMEHESFEDAEVAAIMNEHFINIKVDREERPDVDQVYMDACQLINGNGGWPLNAIALPDGRPLYAGTYYPKQHWIQLLQYFAHYWQNNRQEAMERATALTNGIKTFEQVQPQAHPAFTAQDLATATQRILDSTDFEKGGRAGAPKFPMPSVYRYLLQHHFFTGHERTLAAVTATADNMMNGGIYDHVGGGFARYSVDDRWEIPHFEKMLYDNAQLVSFYSELYRATQNPRYREVVTETLAFIEREMSDEAGGFYSALDADSEGEEGKFYVYTTTELQTVLGSQWPAFTQVFNVYEGGNFEGHHHLTRKPAATVDNATLQAWKHQLLTYRSQRTRPGLDDKVLTAWTALMACGYADAYKALGTEAYRQRAIKAAAFLANTMWQPGTGLFRNYKNGRVTIGGFLDDYSFTARAFLQVYEITFNEQWLTLARQLADYTIQHFYNASTGLFFYTSVNDDPLVARKSETSDNVIPSSNAAMAGVLHTLGLLLQVSDYSAMAQKALLTLKPHVLQHAPFYSHWASLAVHHVHEPWQVAIAGPDAHRLATPFYSAHLPHVLLAGTATASATPLLADKPADATTRIYLCRHKTCGLPLLTTAAALQALTQR